MWPDTIWLLYDDCDISSDGTRTIEEWVAYCLPDLEARKAWYTMLYRLEHWETNNYELLRTLLGVTNTSIQWNHLVVCRYNLVFALLGYTEGQSSKILNCLPHIEHDVSFQKYSPVVYPAAYGNYFTNKKSYGKTLIKRIPYYGKGRNSR